MKKKTLNPEAGRGLDPEDIPLLDADSTESVGFNPPGRIGGLPTPLECSGLFSKGGLEGSRE